MENIIISKEEFLKIISDHCSRVFDTEVKVKAELGIRYLAVSMAPELKLHCEVMGELVPIYDHDIDMALSEYANNMGYTLMDYRYIGGVRRMGMMVSEDTPYFEGIGLEVIKRDDVFTMKKVKPEQTK